MMQKHIKSSNLRNCAISSIQNCVQNMKKSCNNAVWFQNTNQVKVTSPNYFCIAFLNIFFSLVELEIKTHQWYST